MMMITEKCHPEEMQAFAGCPTSRAFRDVGLLPLPCHPNTLSSRYSVIPSAVEGPCVCSALNKQPQVSKSRRRLGGIAEPFASV